MGMALEYCYSSNMSDTDPKSLDSMSWEEALFLKLSESAFEDWNSPEDEEAFRDL
jgi:hypothetical protein